MSDLEKQGGLVGVVINPLSVSEYGCGGEHEGNLFYITWVHNKYLLLTMQHLSQPLIDAFAKVVEYQPFCRYEREEKVTVEWDKSGSEARFAELQIEPSLSNLVAL
jgi:hypothetical protein